MINNNPVITDAAKYLEHPYAGIKANAYDMVLNGNEIGGGSIRIYQRALQEKMFTALGMSKEEALRKFGFLLGAFELLNFRLSLTDQYWKNARLTTLYSH